jgi:hypothetical protein
MSKAVRALVLLLAGLQCRAADEDLLSRICQHMREYAAQLPEYTCRVTIERSARRSARASFQLVDRLRLEIAYSGGREYYAWPGDARFENGIEDLLPGRGLVSNGSYALHLRKLFLTNDAQFGEPRATECDGVACVQVDFLVPAARSGYSLSAGDSSAPAALRGSVWFTPDKLDIMRLQVQIEDTPPGVRIAATREVTVYARTTIGEVEFVLPQTSELVLRDRDGSERRNLSRFDAYRRFFGSATVRYGDAAAPEVAAVPAAKAPEARKGSRVVAVLESGIPADVAIGDQLGASGGFKVRVTDLRRAGDKWSVELSLGRSRVRRTLTLPAPAGAAFTFSDPELH